MMKKSIILLVVCILCVPIVVGAIVSLPIVEWLETSNDWIGFWGGYIGAIIGGIITLLVLVATIKDNQITNEKNRRQDLCVRVANLVSNFCVEMMAYRSKWNALYAKAEGKEISPLDIIEYNATMEEPRRIYFELDILLKNLPEAKELLVEIQSVLEGKITQKSVRDTAAIMAVIREQARIFIEKYNF